MKHRRNSLTPTAATKWPEKWAQKPTYYHDIMERTEVQALQISRVGSSLRQYQGGMEEGPGWEEGEGVSSFKCVWRLHGCLSLFVSPPDSSHSQPPPWPHTMMYVSSNSLGWAFGVAWLSVSQMALISSVCSLFGWWCFFGCYYDPFILQGGATWRLCVEDDIWEKYTKQLRPESRLPYS